MNNIAILVTGQPRCIKVAGKLWSEYWIDTEIANTKKANVKIFVSISNEESTKYATARGTYVNQFGKQLSSTKRTYSKNDIKNSIFACDKINISTDEEIIKQINLLFPLWNKKKTDTHTGSRVWELGMGSVLYQLWYIYDACQLAFQYEKTHNLKFDLFVKIRIDHVPLISEHIHRRLENKVSLFDMFIDNLDRVPDWKNKKIGFLSYFNFFTEEGYSHWWSENLDDINNVHYCNDVMFALSRNSMTTMVEKFKTCERLISEIMIFSRAYFQYFEELLKNFDKQDFMYLRKRAVGDFNKVEKQPGNKSNYREKLELNMLFTILDIPSMLYVFEQTWLKEFFLQDKKEKVTEWVNKMWPIKIRRHQKSEFSTPDKDLYIAKICSNIGNHNMFPTKIKSSEAIHTVFFRLSMDYVYSLPLDEISKYLAHGVPQDEETQFFEQFNWNEKSISKKLSQFYQWNKQWGYA